MALRVLLADESTTIKKVMQLALQDFAVEVKAVQAGIDVLDVARSFKPDVIFVDVLLQKKNGYEVCAMLKNDGELKTVPVILMWSQFMDLDESLARSCGADARLEKPFDVETLRKEVLELVPQTRSQRLAHFLEFSPKLNEELAADPSAIQAPAPPPTAVPPAPRAPAPAPQAPARAVAPQPKPQPPASKSPAYRPPPTQAAAPPPAPIPTPTRAARPGPPSPDSFLQSRGPTGVKPSVQNGPAPSAAASKGWSMESFDDPLTYETPGQPLGESLGDEEESFAPLELSRNSEDALAPLSYTHEANEPSELSDIGDAGGDTSDDAWSRQDLSQFKLDLPPISVGEGHDEFKIDMGEDEFSEANFEVSEDLAAAPPPVRRQPSTPPAHQRQHPNEDFGNDLTLDAGDINGAFEEIPLPDETFETAHAHEEPLEITPSPNRPASSVRVPPGAAQMNAHELETIIRAQSREIIEQVVRKLVPDLAATIIREELERLLEETAVRESRGGKNL